MATDIASECAMGLIARFPAPLPKYAVTTETRFSRTAPVPPKPVRRMRRPAIVLPHPVAPFLPPVPPRLGPPLSFGDRYTPDPVNMLERRAAALRLHLPEFAEQARRKLSQVQLIFMYMRCIADIAGKIEPVDGSDRTTEIAKLWRHLRRGTVALLKRSFDEFARQVTTLLITEPLFSTALRKAFARAGLAIVPREAAHHEDEPLAIVPPEMPPPDVAPKLWADRSPGTKAPQFIRETYAPWIEAGVLTRGALKACDPALYRAYHVWVHRHSEDALTFKETPPPNFIADPSEAIERHRESVKNAMTRYRAKKAMEPSPAA